MITIEEYVIVTNNPMVYEAFGSEKEVQYLKVGFKEILIAVRDMVYLGSKLLTHPLSGSIKPMETYYKSVLLSKKTENRVQPVAVQLIESAIEACDKFTYKDEQHHRQTLEDMQAVDFALISGAIASADA